MRGLEKILDEIRTETDEKVRLIIDEAKSYAEQIKADGEVETQKAVSEIMNKAKKLEKEVTEQARSYGEQKRRKLILEKKQSIIKGIIAEAKERLTELPDEEYFAFLEKMLEKVSHKEQGKILLNKKDKARISKAFSDKLAEEKLTVSEKDLADFGGFILVYGDIEENCTVDAIFGEAEERITDAACSVVFG